MNRLACFALSLGCSALPAGAQSLLLDTPAAPTGSGKGHAVDGGFDIDRDGVDDLVVGLPFASPGGQSERGEAWVVSGVDGSILWRWLGDKAGDRYGWAVAMAGDVDGDGWNDVIVGAPEALHPYSGERTGMIRIHSGQTGGQLLEYRAWTAGDQLGYAVDGGVDWNGDGRADAMAGMPGYAQDNGQIYGFGLTTGGLTNLLTWSTTTPGARVGSSVALLGKNPQGEAMLAWSGPGSKGKDGLVLIGTLDGVYETVSVHPKALDSAFGSVLSSGVDRDGDGAADAILVGAPEDDLGGTDAGRVFLVDVETGDVLTEWKGAKGDRLGSALAILRKPSAGQVLEFAAGAPGDGKGLGHAVVLSDVGPNELLRFSDNVPGSGFGSALGFGGDANADGWPDLAVGAPDAPQGMARIVSAGGPGIVAYCTSGTSASGCTPALTAFGTPSATAIEGFFVDARQVEGNGWGMMFFGTNGRQALPWGNGSSFRCVVPPVKRSDVLPKLGTNGQCDGAFQWDLNARWCPSICPKPHHNPGPGAVVQIQLWYRDPLNTSNQTTSLTNAVEFVVGP